MSIEIVSVNISREKGTVKQPVHEITFCPMGIEEDAHAGRWHRQVSLLAQESIDGFAAASDRGFEPGEFAENITTRGIDLTKVNLLDRFRIGGAELEVTQIGKKCHGDGCAIYREVGQCVMPKEGIFCRVIADGTARAGDVMEYVPYSFDVHIITLSDRAFKGEYPDRSGPQIKQDVETCFAGRPWNICCRITVIPDETATLHKVITESLNEGADVVFTTGGTGIGPRDITVDTLSPMLDKELPGIMEYIRMKYGETIPSALLSRSIAGTIGKTQIYALPGSVKAVKEYMAEITRNLEHAVLMLHGIDSH